MENEHTESSNQIFSTEGVSLLNAEPIEDPTDPPLPNTAQPENHLDPSACSNEEMALSEECHVDSFAPSSSLATSSSAVEITEIFPLTGDSPTEFQDEIGIKPESGTVSSKKRKMAQENSETSSSKKRKISKNKNGHEKLKRIKQLKNIPKSDRCLRSGLKKPINKRVQNLIDYDAN